MNVLATVKSYTDRVAKDIAKEDRRLRGLAGKHVLEQIRAKISTVYPAGQHSVAGDPPGVVTGNLLKGLVMSNGTPTTLVGFKAPGYHARMLEFGTSTMARRPMLFNTMAEEAGTVKRILSEQRV